ncbi:MAG: hypothetical protein GC206_09050 [Alphaproteobacteria bacterium]|nr:hypothetical protein [Alphaproteobacteria bacterium]
MTPAPIRLTARIDRDLGGFRGFTFLLARACVMAGAPAVEICAPKDRALDADERTFLGARVAVRSFARGLPRSSGLEIVQIANTAAHAPLFHRLRETGAIALVHEPQPLNMLCDAGCADAAFAQMFGAETGALIAARLRFARPPARDLLSAATHVLPYILSVSSGAIVHSRYAEALARAARPDLPIARTALIPNDPALFDEAGDFRAPVAARARDRAPIVGLLGRHTRAKASLEALEALVALADEGVRFAVRVGGAVDADLEPRFSAAAQALAAKGMAEIALRRLSEAQHRAWIADCDLVLALRRRSCGESSGIAAEGLAAGAALIACDIDAFAELPRAAVEWVDPSTDDVRFTSSLRDALRRALTQTLAQRRDAAAAVRATVSLRRYAEDYAAILPLLATAGA